MNIRIATAPVSWGVLLKDTPNVPPWQQCVREIAAAGYTGMELGPYGYLPQDIPMLRDFLAELGLNVMGAFAIVNLIDPAARQEEYEETINTCRVIAALGSKWVVLSDSLFVAPIRHERHGRIRPKMAWMTASGVPSPPTPTPSLVVCWMNLACAPPSIPMSVVG